MAAILLRVWRVPCRPSMNVSTAIYRKFSSFRLDSPSFAKMRRGKDAFVDKTGAIADFLTSEEGMRRQRRAFFARPRKFGKSLTLDIAASMLAAGDLPKEKEWPGYEPVDALTLFEGLEVHNRFLRNDPSLGTLLRQPHFVMTLDLGGTLTGAKLEASILNKLASIAGTAFGPALEAEVLDQPTPESALRALIYAVPRGVPVAVLVDEYDTAIVCDVTEHNWDAACEGITALHSLMMSTKSHDVGPRIARFIMTGVARFTRTSIFSGANNFTDFTSTPIMSRVMGFSEAEIRTTFPEDLARFAATEATDVDGAVRKLAHWYDGYCFDGVSSCFNPYAVLSALRNGRISETELAGASGTNWLGLTSLLQVPARSSYSFSAYDVHRMDIADLDAQRVDAILLLLQTGVLSRVPSVASSDDADTCSKHLCRPPNQYARNSLERMVERSLGYEPVPTDFVDALHARDHAAFTIAAMRLLESVPNAVIQRDSEGDEVSPRESMFQSALHMAISVGMRASDGVGMEIPIPPRGIADIAASADIVARFRALEMGGSDTVWIFELGLDDSEAGRRQKLQLAQEYARTISADVAVFCCAIAVSPPQPASTTTGGSVCSFAWSRRASAGESPVWEDLQNEY